MDHLGITEVGRCAKNVASRIAWRTDKGAIGSDDHHLFDPGMGIDSREEGDQHHPARLRDTHFDSRFGRFDSDSRLLRFSSMQKKKETPASGIVQSDCVILQGLCCFSK